MEQAIQSSKQMLKEDDDKDGDDREVKQAVVVCEHARKAGKNLPGSRRRTGEVSSEWCSKLLRTLSFSCLSGWTLAELGRGEKSCSSALRGAGTSVEQVAPGPLNGSNLSQL